MTPRRPEPAVLPPDAAPAAPAPPLGRAPLMSSTVMAGFPSPAEQYIKRPLDLNELLVARPAATYFVRAVGDSMEGAGIRSGDMLVVDRSREPADGSVVIACVDGEFTVKTFRRGRRGDGVRLEAANPAYPPTTSSTATSPRASSPRSGHSRPTWSRI